MRYLCAYQGSTLTVVLWPQAITGNVHLGYRRPDSTCGVSPTPAHCDSAVLPVKSPPSIFSLRSVDPGQVPPSGTLPLAGPDALVVMCIGGGVTQVVTALQISTR